ncbi:MAG: hypothetical protein RSD97_10530 [Lachnospiraceae bacterium]
MCENLCVWWGDNWLTIASIVLSGLISLIISAAYYHKENRNNLQMSFIFPAIKLLEGNYSSKGYQQLCELNDSFVTRYLSKKEIKAWQEILPAYKKIMNHTKCDEEVESICSYFEYKLKSENVELTPVPIEYEGEIMYYDYPPNYNYLPNDIERVISGYYEDEELIEQMNLEGQVKDILNYYADELYGKKDVGFFKDFNLYKVLSVSQVRKKWQDKYTELDDAKKKFFNLKIVKKCTQSKENE